ncbi:MAG: hypothetical protein B6242_13360 [Anaerolineaceae bacterium 4572_78]|nr:MAG: hypothetical protein B6242_13360 [Anaerolineaceae bacterium 4572_78]
MNTSMTRLKQIVKKYKTDMVAFAQKLIQTPSLSGEEELIAQIVQDKMKKLGYDDVSTDDYGNIIGYIKGGDAPSLMLNGHLDHVDPGEESTWQYPPFSGEIVNGIMWGRGAVDIKGPVAAMVYAPAVIKELHKTPPGDTYVVAPVMEELGCVGTKHLMTHFKTDLAVVCEPSRNTIRLGNRGGVGLDVTVTGKSVHASIPAKGLNPHYIVADFLHKLRTLEMVKHNVFGSSSVAPTLYRTDQSSFNVTPGEIRLTLDWRTVPNDSLHSITKRVNSLLQRCIYAQAKGKVDIATFSFKTYTGISDSHPAIFPSCYLPPEHPFPTQAQKTLSIAFKRNVPFDVWHFITDAGPMMDAGIPTIGFGPGDEMLAHTNQEHISINQLTEALLGYATLCLMDRG